MERELREPFLIHVGGGEISSIEPPAQLAKKPELFSPVLSAVALLE
jgi:hypothetical protein